MQCRLNTCFAMLIRDLLVLILHRFVPERLPFYEQTTQQVSNIAGGSNFFHTGYPGEHLFNAILAQGAHAIAHGLHL